MPTGHPVLAPLPRGTPFGAVVNAIIHNHIKPRRLSKQGVVARRAASMPVAGGLALAYASVSTITARNSSPEGWRFTSRQPMRSGATSSAGRQKYALGWAMRFWMGWVAMGVAWRMGGGYLEGGEVNTKKIRNARG